MFGPGVDAGRTRPVRSARRSMARSRTRSRGRTRASRRLNYQSAPSSSQIRSWERRNRPRPTRGSSEGDLRRSPKKPGQQTSRRRGKATTRTWQNGPPPTRRQATARTHTSPGPLPRHADRPQLGPSTAGGTAVTRTRPDPADLPPGYASVLGAEVAHRRRAAAPAYAEASRRHSRFSAARAAPFERETSGQSRPQPVRQIGHHERWHTPNIRATGTSSEPPKRGG
jgi:hypothetical protein